MYREVECSRGAFSSQTPGLLKCIDVFDQTVGLLEVSYIFRKRIIESCGTFHQSREIFRLNILRHVGSLKLRMDAVLRGVPVWVRSDPAVVMDGRMERLRSIPDIMTEPTGVEDDGLLYGMGRLMCGLPLPVLAERSFQPAIHFHSDVGLQSHTLGKIVVRILCSGCALFIELAIELIAAGRKRVEPRDAFEIDEVIWLLRILESEL